MIEQKVFFRIGESFKPSPDLKGYYFVIMVLVLLGGVFSWYIPLFVYGELLVSLLCAIPIALLFFFWTFWIPLYYDTIVYRATHDEISWNRGVWFRRTGIVPYSRITNIDIVQGPVMRWFGISSLKIQTAGYSAQARSEITIEGILEPEELRELILPYVRKTGAIDEGSLGKPGNVQERILAELVLVRSLLEEITRTGK